MRGQTKNSLAAAGRLYPSFPVAPQFAFSCAASVATPRPPLEGGGTVAWPQGALAGEAAAW
eukprot:COSAG06_NODE_51193_length_313_cov_4.322430_1_plen_60_part_10